MPKQSHLRVYKTMYVHHQFRHIEEILKSLKIYILFRWHCVSGMRRRMELRKLPSGPSFLVVLPRYSRNMSSISQQHSSTSLIHQMPSDITHSHAFARKDRTISFQKAIGQLRRTHILSNHDFQHDVDLVDSDEIGKDEYLKPLTSEQAVALDVLKEGKNIFLTGPAGSGKSEIIKHMKKYLIKNDIEFAVTASTGVAALSIKGQTLHSWAGLGKGDQPLSYYRDKYMWMRREIDEKSEEEVKEIYAMVSSSSGVHDPYALQSTEASEEKMELMIQLMKFQKLREAEVLIVDEISMVRMPFC